MNGSLQTEQQPQQQLPPPPPPLPYLQRLAPVPFAVLSLAIIFFLYQIIAGSITVLLFGLKVSNNQVQLFRTATLIGQLLFILLPTILLVKFRGERVMQYFRLAVPDYKEIILTVVAV